MATRATPQAEYLSRLVQRSFDAELTQTYGKEFIERGVATITDVSQQLRRTILLIIIAAVAFVLVGSGAVKELTVSGIKITDINVVAKLLPALIGFLSYEATLHLTNLSALRIIVQSTVGQVAPGLEKAGLDRALLPAIPALLGSVPIIMLGQNRSRHAYRILRVLGIATNLLVMLFPIGFLSYAYVALFDLYGSADAVVWLSAAVATLSTVRLLALVSLWNRQPAAGRHA